MRVLERPVRFEEVDAAGIVYFAQIVSYVHEAMEAFFDQVEGGYARLINERRVGFPAVRLDSEFEAPLRYGDRLRIETSVKCLGTRSVTFSYRILRERDGRLCATVHHTVVTTDLDALESCAMPDDVRAVLEAHLEG